MRKITHQAQMQRICDEWMITARNLDILEKQFGKSSRSYQSTYKRMKQQEQIITANGFMYLVTGRDSLEHREITVMFRPKRVKNYNIVLKNWLKKTNREHWTETQMANIPFDINE